MLECTLVFCTRSKSCFGGLIEQSGYLVFLYLKPAAAARQCLTEADLTALRRAWLERKNQFATTRIFPPPVSREGEMLKDLEGSNRKMAAWYKGKCLMDVSWCG